MWTASRSRRKPSIDAGDDPGKRPAKRSGRLEVSACVQMPVVGDEQVRGVLAENRFGPIKKRHRRVLCVGSEPDSSLVVGRCLKRTRQVCKNQLEGERIAGCWNRSRRAALSSLHLESRHVKWRIARMAQRSKKNCPPEARRTGGLPRQFRQPPLNHFSDWT
jgi:hypothetical protein